MGQLRGIASVLAYMRVFAAAAAAAALRPVAAAATHKSN
jgi:hypothetical protein